MSLRYEIVNNPALHTHYCTVKWTGLEKNISFPKNDGCWDLTTDNLALINFCLARMPDGIVEILTDWLLLMYDAISSKGTQLTDYEIRRLWDSLLEDYDFAMIRSGIEYHCYVWYTNELSYWGARKTPRPESIMHTTLRAYCQLFFPVVTMCRYLPEGYNLRWILPLMDTLHNQFGILDTDIDWRTSVYEMLADDNHLCMIPYSYIDLFGVGIPQYDPKKEIHSHHYLRVYFMRSLQARLLGAYPDKYATC